MHATFSFAFGPFSWAHTDCRPVIQNPTPPAATVPPVFRKSRRLDLLDIEVSSYGLKFLARLAHDREALLHVGDRVLLVQLVLDREDARELDLLEGLQDADDVQLALAQDVLRLRVGEVLQVDVVDARAQRLDPVDRVLAGPEHVAGVDARADLDGPLLDRLLDLLQAAVGLVVGSVVVDRDLDPVFLGERGEAFEAVGGGIRAVDREAHRLGELEGLLRVVGVLGEALDAPREDLHARGLQLLLRGLDLGLVVRDREVLGVELAVLQAELDEVLERLVQVERAQRVRLEPRLEAGVFGLGEEAARHGGQGGAGDGALEKVATGHAHQFSFLESRRGNPLNLVNALGSPKRYTFLLGAARL